MTTAPALRLSPWDDVAERLGELLGGAPFERPRLVPFESGEAPGRVAAVDGSSCVLGETGAFLVGAYRAAAVLVEPMRRGARPMPFVQDLRVALLEEARPQVEATRALQAAGYDGPLRSPADTLHLLRELAEMEASLDALERLDAGDALLVDGPLRAKPFPTLARRLVERARARGIDIVGVCKSTSLTVGGVPALAACHLCAREQRLTRWHAELAPPPLALGRIFVAALSPADRRAFRFDVVAHDGDAARALARLVPLARHPAYPGYPAALALAHNVVTLTEDLRARMRTRLAEAAERRGVREDVWRAAFEDYHDVLDLGV